MNLYKYQPLARRTMKELRYAEHVLHMTLGVNGELGELADAVKKHTIYGKPLDIVNLNEEGGDGWWYLVGFQPELHADIFQMQTEFERGVNNGLAHKEFWTLGRTVTLVQRNIADRTYSLLTYGEDEPPKGLGAEFLYSCCYDMGTLYGRAGMDLSASLTANIAKLAKRYGDKYSDVAALNRDLAGERSVLEANLPAAA